MHVDGLRHHGAAVGEGLHLLHQPHHPLALALHQIEQRTLGGRHHLLEQLRRAADAGERVLDLVGEQHGECGEGAARAGVHQMAVHPLRHRPRQQQDHHLARRVGNGRDVDVEGGVEAAAGGDGESALAHRLVAAAGAGEEGEEGRIPGQQLAEGATQQMAATGPQQLLAGTVDVADAVGRRERQHRSRQQIEQQIGAQRRGPVGGHGRSARLFGRRIWSCLRSGQAPRPIEPRCHRPHGHVKSRFVSLSCGDVAVVPVCGVKIGRAGVTARRSGEGTQP
ncbi:hypothetical protein HRbin39_01316 [bacterium HR39]|nr:hypothetical protein HRbin39_01316 [bacterium HR39]